MRLDASMELLHVLTKISLKFLLILPVTCHKVVLDRTGLVLAFQRRSLWCLLGIAAGKQAQQHWFLDIVPPFDFKILNYRPSNRSTMYV